MSGSFTSTIQVLREMDAAATKILEAMSASSHPTSSTTTPIDISHFHFSSAGPLDSQLVDIGVTTEVAKRLSDIYQQNTHYLRLKFEGTFRTTVEKVANMSQAPGMTPVEDLVAEFFDTLHTLYKDTADGWARESMDLARSHLAAQANRTQSKWTGSSSVDAAQHLLDGHIPRIIVVKAILRYRATESSLEAGLDAPSSCTLEIPPPQDPRLRSADGLVHVSSRTSKLVVGDKNAVGLGPARATRVRDYKNFTLRAFQLSFSLVLLCPWCRQNSFPLEIPKLTKLFHKLPTSVEEHTPVPHSDNPSTLPKRRFTPTRLSTSRPSSHPTLSSSRRTRGSGTVGQTRGNPLTPRAAYMGRHTVRTGRPIDPQLLDSLTGDDESTF
ncbi:hypothetical protein JB92DRAFT_2826548 [Gautieria morchelliformis]|nr:hypothetical protein JB92DRAFT_2826548 [Gautieria morchelliformis]